MKDTITILDLVNFIIVLMLSTALHEMAHAWLADRFGDDTPRRAGRLTWNPWPHLHPIWSIALPAFLYWSSDGNAFLAAASTPVNPLAMRDRRWHPVITSLGGPAMNLVILVVATLALGMTLAWSGSVSAETLGDMQASSDTFLFRWFGEAGFRAKFTGAHLCFLFLRLNAFLFVFNMLPLPPLDGGSIVHGFLPVRLREPFWRMRRFCFMILIVLMFTGVLGPVFEVMDWMATMCLRGGIEWGVFLNG